MTSAVAGDRPRIETMYVAHRAFRRELRAAPLLVRGVRNGDTARAGTVGRHLRAVLDRLHLHAESEGTELWPRLLRRARPAAEIVSSMRGGCDRLVSSSTRVRTLVDVWTAGASDVRGEQLARAVDHLRHELSEHLDLEEREVLPLVVRHITSGEYRRWGIRASGSTTATTLPVVLGMIVEDASDDERPLMLADLSWPVRVLTRVAGPAVHRRYAARLHGV